MILRATFPEWQPIEGPYAILFNCFDPRVQEPVQEYCKKYLRLNFAYKTSAGGCDAVTCTEEEIFQRQLEHIKIALNNIGITQVVLFAHTDCKRYGKFDTHEADMQHKEAELIRAVQRLRQHYEHLEYRCFITSLEKGATKIQEVEVAKLTMHA